MSGRGQLKIFRPGDRVRVVRGRRFEHFEAGDAGLVGEVDAEGATCRVTFYSTGETVTVACRYLEADRRGSAGDGTCRTPTPAQSSDEEGMQHGASDRGRAWQMTSGARPSRSPNLKMARTCPQCGNMYAEDSIFCRRCGRKRDSEIDTEVVPGRARIVSSRVAREAADALFASLDTNRDGVISRREFEAGRRRASVREVSFDEEVEQLPGNIHRGSAESSSCVQQQVDVLNRRIASLENQLSEFSAMLTQQISKDSALAVEELRRSVREDSQDTKVAVEELSARIGDLEEKASQKTSASTSGRSVVALEEAMKKEHREIRSKMDSKLEDLSETVKKEVADTLRKTAASKVSKAMVEDLERSMQKDHQELSARLGKQIDALSTKLEDSHKEAACKTPPVEKRILREQRDIRVEIENKFKELTASLEEKVFEGLRKSAAKSPRSPPADTLESRPTDRSVDRLEKMMRRELREIREDVDKKIEQLSAHIQDSLQGGRNSQAVNSPRPKEPSKKDMDKLETAMRREQNELRTEMQALAESIQDKVHDGIRRHAGLKVGSPPKSTRTLVEDTVSDCVSKRLEAVVARLSTLEASSTRNDSATPQSSAMSVSERQVREHLDAEVGDLSEKARLPIRARSVPPQAGGRSASGLYSNSRASGITRAALRDMDDLDAARYDRAMPPSRLVERSPMSVLSDPSHRITSAVSALTSRPVVAKTLTPPRLIGTDLSLAPSRVNVLPVASMPGHAQVWERCCPDCGNVYMPDAYFCRKCGHKRDMIPAPAGPFPLHSAPPTPRGYGRA
eukprot:TRINITY_DN23636_c0_g1_i1.p1 TRINITY_DN23636_c0_g1~~TRINITY_DN23636_c0_g1_i1.p1  ORF type:complete len:796 (-),score=158.05 TRINITY_DN23636_c0_g1_i1:83-2470(-)